MNSSRTKTMNLDKGKWHSFTIYRINKNSLPNNHSFTLIRQTKYHVNPFVQIEPLLFYFVQHFVDLVYHKRVPFDLV